MVLDNAHLINANSLTLTTNPVPTEKATNENFENTMNEDLIRNLFEEESNGYKTLDHRVFTTKISNFRLILCKLR